MKLITKWGKDSWMVYEDEDLGTPAENLESMKKLLTYGGVVVVYTILMLTFGFLFVFDTFK